MTMRRHPAWAHYHLNARPATYHEAQVSLPFSVAIALLEGGALPPQYQNDKLKVPEVLRLSEMLTVVPTILSRAAFRAHSRSRPRVAKS